MPEGPEKEALKKRLADGRAAKAAERAAQESNDKVAKATKLGEILAKGSKSIAAKKPASKRKLAAKKKPTKDAT